MNFVVVGIFSMLWARTCSLDTQSMLQLYKFPGGPSGGSSSGGGVSVGGGSLGGGSSFGGGSFGGGSPGMASFGFPDNLPGVSWGPMPESCEEDCSCGHHEWLQGEYSYAGFFPANGRAETWCFSNLYMTQTCIEVTCSVNGTSCNFGSHQVDTAALRGPDDTNLVIRARYEPDLLNFSVGLVMEGLSFEAESVCALDDGTSCVGQASGARLSVMDAEEETTYFALDMPRCFDATLAPTHSLTPSPTPALTPFPPALTPFPAEEAAAAAAEEPGEESTEEHEETIDEVTIGGFDFGGASPAHASGDPHCTNMRGENFEVYKRGKINMVTIPQGSDEANADFSVAVVVTPTWWKKCAAAFITLAVITRESSCEKITIRPGDGLMPAVEKLPNAEKTCNQTSALEEVGEKTVMLRVGDRIIKFWQTTKYDKYLNMDVYGLAKEKQKVGGILGVDDHEDEAEVPEECKGRKRGLSEKAGNFAVTSISFARVV